MALIPGMESINYAPMIANAIYWLGIVLFSTVILGGMYFVYRTITFNIKATIFPLYGSGKDGVFSIGKPKTNRLRWTKNRTAWQKLKPLFNKKELKPFDSEYIYPGNHIFAYELNDELMPGRIDIGLEEEKIRLTIKPVPYEIRNWQSFIHKKHSEEFAKINFWEQNKQMLLTAGVCVAILVAVSVTVYFTYEFATGGTAKMSALTDAITNMNVIKGVAPGT